MAAAAWEIAATVALVAAGCATGSPAGTDASGSKASDSPPAATTATPAADAAIAEPAASAAGKTSAGTATTADAGASAAADGGAHAAADAGALPNVEVTNIGMHIGGGPNDAVTKDPIARSVAPRFDAFRSCFAGVDDTKKAGDFGIDLLIPAEGGKAEVSHPRTAIKGAAFKPCMVQAFESVEFLKPRGGRTKVSYSLRFTPR